MQGPVQALKHLRQQLTWALMGLPCRKARGSLSSNQPLISRSVKMVLHRNADQPQVWRLCRQDRAVAWHQLAVRVMTAQHVAISEAAKVRHA